MGRFDRQIAMALRLIKKNGEQVNWIKPGRSIPDGDKPWLTTPAADLSYAPFICFLPLDREGREFLMAMGRSEALTGSYYGLMGQVSFNPSKTDKVLRNGVSLGIESIDLLQPNEQKILYTIIFNG